MRDTFASVDGKRKRQWASFTLIELLTVIVIISILAALIASTGWGVYQKSMRSRSLTEIQAITSALDAYKADNGNFPQSDGVLTTNTPYASYDGTSQNYQTNSQILYQALSGQTNFLDTPVNKSYYGFKLIQLGNNQAPAGTTGAGTTYIVDPWGQSYGYSTGSSTFSPNTGPGFFDVWSTGGLLVANVNTNAWIGNWIPQ